ncbi:TonB-dependent receptor [Mycoavidus cysteinexigens]|uniref:TonB-dependent receptor n=2 Tax=Mycoavidus cysteinexigens TaxID=1553431 RepID=A0A2Z6EWM4_9BURK|nr:TonB-dependent receptor [Mycoavidus cysteinexigens]GLR01317.1 outer membrane receptor protein [Mycoavidus cysteinexigens]
MVVILMTLSRLAHADTNPSDTEKMRSVKLAINPIPVQPPVLAQVVVTASRMALPLKHTLAPTTLFNQQDMVESGALDLPALLPVVAGVQVVRSGGPGATSSLFLRGAAASQTLVLIDGVRVDSASLGSAQLSQLMLDQFERIEVESGNASALYGSNAIGGAVHIFTKEGGQHAPKLNFSAEMGSHHTQHQQVGMAGALDAAGDTTFNLNGSRLKTAGFAARERQPMQVASPPAYGFFTESIGTQLKHRFTPSWLAGIRFYQSEGAVGSDLAYGCPTDLNLAHNRVRTASIFVDGKLGQVWRTSLLLASSNDQNLNWLNGIFDNHFSTTNRQLTWQNELTLRPKQRLRFGYEYLQQNLDASLYAAASRHLHASFAGYQVGLGAHQLQFNVRRDQSTQFDVAHSYYAGYGYSFDPYWKFTASHSTAFRVPSFNDLYYPNYGNAKLQPESSHAVEAGIEHVSDQLGMTRLSVFQTRYNDLIEAIPIPPAESNVFQLYQAQNIGRARVQGLEATWHGRVLGTRIRSSVTAQRALDETHKRDLPRRARYLANLFATRRLGDWQVGGLWLMSGQRHDNGTLLGGYGVVNLNARYDISRSWYFATRIENLLNKNHELVHAYRAAPRSVYFTLGWRQR